MFNVGDRVMYRPAYCYEQEKDITLIITEVLSDGSFLAVAENVSYCGGIPAVSRLDADWIMPAGARTGQEVYAG